MHGGRGALALPPAPLPGPDLTVLPLAGAVTSSAALRTLRLYPSSQMLLPQVCAQLSFILLLSYYITGQVSRGPQGTLQPGLRGGIHGHLRKGGAESTPPIQAATFSRVSPPQLKCRALA